MTSWAPVRARNHCNIWVYNCIQLSWIVWTKIWCGRSLFGVQPCLGPSAKLWLWQTTRIIFWMNISHQIKIKTSQPIIWRFLDSQRVNKSFFFNDKTISWLVWSWSKPLNSSLWIINLNLTSAPSWGVQKIRCPSFNLELSKQISLAHILIEHKITCSNQKLSKSTLVVEDIFTLITTSDQDYW